MDGTPQTDSAGRTVPGLHAFLADRDGAASLIMLFMVLGMMAVGALAVDTMRHERERVRLQATLDQAVLAAADVEHDRDPRTILEDWFETAGLAGALDPDRIEVVQGLNHRSVNASASFEMPTALMHLLGVDSLDVPSTAAAEETHNDIEISLVLDVSGSMADHSRLANLQTAARTFVDTVTERSAALAGLTTVSIVPYSMTVNLGHEIAGLYNVVPHADELVHPYSSCVLFDDDDFADTALPPTRELEQYPHFDCDDGDNWGTAYLPGAVRRISTPLCPRASADDPGSNPLTPIGTDAGALKAAISALTAYDATGIDAGVRWGVAMLDPSAQPVVDALIASGTVDASAAGRPYAYDRENTLKVLVLMTDGDPDGQRDHPSEVKSGWSNVWYDNVTGRYSVLVRGRHLSDFDYDRAERLPAHSACTAFWTDSELASAEVDGIARVAASPIDDLCPPRWYWVQNDDARIRQQWQGPWHHEFHDHPASQHAGTDDENDWDVLTEDGELVRLTNQAVYDHFTGFDAVEFLYRPLWDHRDAANRRWLSSAEWDILNKRKVTTNSADGATTRLLDLCTAAKAIDRNILIFTVGFELDRIGRASDRDRAYRLMRSCASSSGHFFDVTSLMAEGAIAEAFEVIASQIQQLRLTR